MQESCDFSYRIRRSVLNGTVNVPGAKNSALRLLAASLLTEKDVLLTNYPGDLLDSRVHVEMLRALGKECYLGDGEVLIQETGEVKPELEWRGRSIRNTLLILGALTARLGYGAVPMPGGCRLGERKYDLHVMVLERLGAQVRECEKTSRLYASVDGRLSGADIYLPIRSTGATENAVICGSLASGTTTIWNPHVRPEILDLISLLRKMGVEIEVYGQEKIRVHGAEGGLSGVVHEVIPDNMEAITWLIASVMTGGDITISNFPVDHLEVPVIHLRESGAKVYFSENEAIVRGGRCYPVEISTGPFPGINSDMQPLFAAYGAIASGESRIIDLRFPGRYAYATEFKKLGIDCEIKDNLLVIRGGKPLRGTDVTASDLRAGVALSILGLVSDGTTVVHDAWQVERGYSQFVKRIQALGGDVEYVDAAA